MLTIDINVPTISEDRRVWRMFPGQSYRFLEDYRDQGLVFLDLPGFPYPRGPISEVEDVAARISLSQQVRQYIQENGSEDIPQLRLEQFANAINSQSRGRTRQALINLHEEATEGDLVILPEPIYMSQVFIGRLGNRRVINARSPERYGEAILPGRRIEWLGTYPENTISTKLSTSLRNQHAFTLIEQSLFTEVFSLAYGSFIYRDRHVSTVYNEDEFLDSDSAFLSNLSRLAAAACASMDRGEDGLSVDNLANILLSDTPIEYSCNQESDIHSKGFTRYISGTMVSIVISVLASSYIELSKHDNSKAIAQEIENLVLINTSPNADPNCTAWVTEATKRVFDMLPLDKSLAICDAARSSRRRGLKPSARPRPRDLD